jgi:GNAT superfamily N-acetyltransferase
MEIEIYRYSNEDIDDEMKEDIESWSNCLWYNDLDQAGVELTILAWDDNDIIGYQTVNSCHDTVAIEVHPDYQGKGIARLMIEESLSYRPDRNENPDFWAWAESEFGD